MRRITGLLYAAHVADRIPLFPLNTPLVPGLVLPLHIFEPRYRALVRELLAKEDDDSREFGIVAVREGMDVARDGTDALHPIGVSAILRQVEELDDGRFDIITTGNRRFVIRELDASAPLLRGEVDFLAEATGPQDAALATRVAHAFRGYRAALGGQVQASIGDDTVPDDPTVLSYLVTAAMVLPQAERQELLAAPSVAARLSLELALLGRETMLISELSAVPALDIPGSPPSVN